MPSEDFSEGRLRALLGHSHARQITWRHDVDYSLSAALRMAEMEAEYDIQATYYLMTASPYYNLFSKDSEQAIATLHALGHTLGLHAFVERDKSPKPVLLRDYDLLDAAYPEVFSLRVSFHVPGPRVLWTIIDGYENAYEPKWKWHYISDSRGEFAYEQPEDRMENPPLQVNLHSEHWFEPDWQDNLDPEVYERFFLEPYGRLVTTSQR